MKYRMGITDQANTMFIFMIRSKRTKLWIFAMCNPMGNDELAIMIFIMLILQIQSIEGAMMLKFIRGIGLRACCYQDGSSRKMHFFCRCDPFIVLITNAFTTN